MINPKDNRCFVICDSGTRKSANEIRLLIEKGDISPTQPISTTDGDIYLAGHIATCRAPKWLMSQEHDYLLPEMKPVDEATMQSILDELPNDFFEGIPVVEDVA